MTFEVSVYVYLSVCLSVCLSLSLSLSLCLCVFLCPCLGLFKPLYYYLFCICCSFIHSGYFYSASSSPLLLSMDTVSEFHTKAPQATASEGLAQSPTCGIETHDPSNKRRRFYKVRI